jgi:hypothetical protein
MKGITLRKATMTDYKEAHDQPAPRSARNLAHGKEPVENDGEESV